MDKLLLVVVVDLDAAIAFFVELGVELEGARRSRVDRRSSSAEV